MEWYYWLIIGLSVLILFMLFEWFRNFILGILSGIYHLGKTIVIGAIIVVLGIWLAWWIFIRFLL